MTLQELRFFSIYLSKINTRDVNTRIVRFPLSEFQKIMDFGRLNTKQINDTTDSLLCKIVKVPSETGGFNKFQLFKNCKVDIDEGGHWYIEINAHDEALPLMFEFKERYFTYELWNALKLKSSNQLRMYELLKQYERIGERILKIEELKELLGIGLKEYPRFGDFKVKVLDSCRAALEEHTDIKFTYEPTGKKGRGGKIFYLKFTIFKNNNYKDQLMLDDFINYQDLPQQEDTYNNLEFYAEACNNEFTPEEIQVLYNFVIKIIPQKLNSDNQLERYDYIKRKYDELNFQASRRRINRRFGYLKTIIESDLEE